MDIRILFVLLAVIAILAFFIGRRTAPSGKALHKLQKDLDHRRQELSQFKEQTHEFMDGLQLELDRVSSAYRDLQEKIKQGNAKLGQRASAGQSASEQTAMNEDQALPSLACPLPSEKPAFDAPRDYSPVRGTLKLDDRAYA